MTKYILLFKDREDQRTKLLFRSPSTVLAYKHQVILV